MFVFKGASVVPIGDTFFTLGGRGVSAGGVGSYQWVPQTESWEQRPEETVRVGQTAIIMEQESVTCA